MVRVIRTLAGGALCVPVLISGYDSAVQTQTAERPTLSVRPVEDFQVTGAGDHAAWRQAEWVSLRRRQDDGHPYDTRFKAVVVNSFTPPHGAFLAAVARDRERQAHFCSTMPGENRVLRQEDWFYLIAPRPLLLVHGEAEAHSGLEFVFAAHKAFAAGRYGRAVVPGAGHEFFTRETSEFLMRHLNASDGPSAHD